MNTWHVSLKLVMKNKTDFIIQKYSYFVFLFLLFWSFKSFTVSTWLVKLYIILVRGKLKPTTSERGIISMLWRLIGGIGLISGLWSGCCLFDTFIVSILYSIHYWNVNWCYGHIVAIVILARIIISNFNCFHSALYVFILFTFNPLSNMLNQEHG